MAHRVVIWDLDGVIVDTAAWHFAAWRQICQRHGRNLSEDQFLATFGQRNEEIIRTLFGPALLEATVRGIAGQKEMLFRAAVDRDARPSPGVVSLLGQLKAAGYAQAIGSSAPIANIILLTDILGIAPFFDAITSGEDVAVGKPAPDVFLGAAARLGIAPSSCLVIEDAPAGVAAARAAGMACLGVAGARDKKELRDADLVVRSLDVVDLATIDRLIDDHRGGDGRH
jgi:beta-phosphoglucomutase family hydrolase